MTRKNKKIKVLITAGPTWVRLDKVRVLTNIFTGRTGLLIAKELSRKGFKVRLLLGPSRTSLKGYDFPIKRFKFFDELKDLVKAELKDKSIKAVIHSAAVSDYKPCKIYKAKIPSSKKDLVIRIKPTEKIIAEIKKKRKDIFLVQFKLEVGLRKQDLINRAYRSLIKNRSDLVVANDFKDFKGLSFKSYVVDKDKKIYFAKNRKVLAQRLAYTLGSVPTHYQGR
jgi:phosphopantothenoylcysteine decarboxylase/phosphopantothenate--cysteine ligase